MREVNLSKTQKKKKKKKNYARCDQHETLV